MNYHYNDIVAVQRYGMSKIAIFLGSEYIIRKPATKMGKIHNDSGQGDCTEDLLETPMK